MRRIRSGLRRILEMPPANALADLSGAGSRGDMAGGLEVRESAPAIFAAGKVGSYLPSRVLVPRRRQRRRGRARRPSSKSWPRRHVLLFGRRRRGLGLFVGRSVGMRSRANSTSPTRAAPWRRLNPVLAFKFRVAPLSSWAPAPEILPNPRGRSNCGWPRSTSTGIALIGDRGGGQRNESCYR